MLLMKNKKKKLGFIVWILVTFFNNNGGFGNYEHEDMDHDMPTHVIIDK